MPGTIYQPTTTAELLAAAASAAAGDKIVLPAHALEVDQTLSLADGVTVEGQPGSTLVSNAYMLFDLSNSTGVTLANFAMELVGGYGVRGAGLADATFTALSISGNTQTLNTSGAGFFITNSTGVTVEDCDLTHTFGGIYVVESHDTRISDNELDEVAWGNVVVSGADITITGNQIDRAGYTTTAGVANGDGITIGHADNLTITDNLVTNGFCYGLWLTDNATDVVIARNTFSGSITAAIQLASVTGGVIEQNILTDNTYGLMLTDGHDIHVTGNTFVRNAAWFDPLTTNVTVTGNRFEIGSGVPVEHFDETVVLSDNEVEYPTSSVSNAAPEAAASTLVAVQAGVVFELNIADLLSPVDPNGDYVFLALYNDAGEALFYPEMLYSRGSSLLTGYLPPHFGVREFDVMVDDIHGAKTSVRLTLVEVDPDGAIQGSEVGEALRAGAGAAILNGLGGDDDLAGGGGDDQLFGGDGDDVLHGGAGADLLDGGEGLDTVLIDYSDRTGGLQIDGSSGLEFDAGDTLVSIERYKLVTGAGDDRITADDVLTWIEAGAGDDRLQGGSAKDLLYGQAGADDLEGGGDDDQLFGGDGDDILRATAGFDRLDGQAGNDTFILGDVSAVVSGGAGIDTIDYSGFWTGVRVSLMLDVGGVGGQHQISGVEHVIGSNWRDLLVGLNLQNDILEGGGGDDALYGFSGDDMLDGGEGDDILDGGLGDDLLTSAAGFDQLQGGGGDDRIVITAQRAAIDGGDGIDTVDYSSFWTGVKVSLMINVGGVGSGHSLLNIERVIGSAYKDLLIGFNLQDDYLEGGGGDDSLHGYSGDDTLVGGEGSDTLDGGLGDDQLDGGEGDDVLNGGDGDDLLTGAAGVDELYGDDGNDRFAVTATQATVDGGAGVDTLDYSGFSTAVVVNLMNDHGGVASGHTIRNIEHVIGTAFSDLLIGFNGQADTLEGGGGDDVLYGFTGDDILIGGEGADVIYGQDGDDILRGGDGDDQLVAGFGVDTLHGEAGDDHLSALGRQAVIDGGDGFDTVDYSDYDMGLTVSLPLDVGGVGSGHMLISIEGVIGSRYDDLIVGMNGPSNLLSGGDGNDTIIALAGDDQLSGDAGDDVLDGGAGNDRLTGGAGADTFVFSHLGGTDVVTDYQAGVDVLDLSALHLAASDVAISHTASGDTLVTLGHGGESAIIHLLGVTVTEADLTL